MRGKSKGFGDSIISFASLAGGIVLGALLTERITEALILTSLDEIISENFSKALMGDSPYITEWLPERLSNVLVVLGTESTTVTVFQITKLFITVLSFLAVVFVVWSVASALRRRLRKDRREGGLIGTADIAAGLIIGAIKGALLVMLLLAFMFPLAGVFAPDKISLLNEQLNNSYIAGPIYDINPILMFVNKTPS